MTHFGVIIPARYGSSRFPGKPLALLAGRPMVQWVTEVAARSGADFAMVATDDERIQRAVEEFGGRAVMTRQDHVSGTDRLAEAATKAGLDDDTIVVNLQGDEPLLPPEHIQLVADALAEDEALALATLATPITDRRDLFDPNVVKVVLNQRSIAQTFSRAPVPWARDHFARESAETTAEETQVRPLPVGPTFLRHVGLYAYRVGTLKRLAAEQPVAWELAESLEQLRALWLGMSIAVRVVDEPPPHGIDTKSDLERAEQHLARSLERS